MYAVTGITTQVGGVAGRTLLNAGLSVRAVVRDAAKGAARKKCRCEVALADMNDAPALFNAEWKTPRGLWFRRAGLPCFDEGRGFKSCRPEFLESASFLSLTETEN
jgi:hypothetical protein